MSEDGSKNLKENNKLFYNSKFGLENITREIPSFNFICDRFGVKIPQGASVIEIGCGTASCLLSLKCETRVGLDISTVNLTIAKRRNQELILVCADAENIPFQEKCFDIVLIVDLLHHVPVPANVIKECSRILKKTGQVFIFDACRDGVKPISPVAMFVEWLSKRWGNNIETLGPSLSELSSWLDSYKLHVLKRFGEGTFMRYINSMASSLLGKFGMPLPHKVQRIFSSFDKKLQICSKKFPIKIGIMAIKRMNT